MERHKEREIQSGKREGKACGERGEKQKER
jgi:hypothetical protein